jgi:hypothetical protein
MSKNSAYFSVTPFGAYRDAKALRQAFNRSCDGILSVSTDNNGNLVSVEFDDKSVTPQMLRDCLTNMGYTVNHARMEYYS